MFSGRMVKFFTPVGLMLSELVYVHVAQEEPNGSVSALFPVLHDTL